MISDLYARSGAARFGLDQSRFGEILTSVAAKYWQATGLSEGEFYKSLKLEDLALARACAAGHELAWEVFLTRFREKLYDMARGITREDSSARELADSLYAGLYGLNTRQGSRLSKLASYTGRGSLEGWLRTVLAQEHVNRYRTRKRLVSLDEESEAGAQFAAAVTTPEPVVDMRLEIATGEALGALSSQDRCVLASYYLDGRTLADIARTMGVHESTISRKLDKLAKSLRKQIVAGLQRRGMSRRQALEALDADVRDLQFDIRNRLTQESPGSSFSESKPGPRK